eukprot:gene12062-25279_t
MSSDLNQYEDTSKSGGVLSEEHKRRKTFSLSALLNNRVSESNMKDPIIEQQIQESKQHDDPLLEDTIKTKAGDSTDVDSHFKEPAILPKPRKPRNLQSFLNDDSEPNLLNISPKIQTKLSSKSLSLPVLLGSADDISPPLTLTDELTPIIPINNIENMEEEQEKELQSTTTLLHSSADPTSVFSDFSLQSTSSIHFSNETDMITILQSSSPSKLKHTSQVHDDYKYDIPTNTISNIAIPKRIETKNNIHETSRTNNSNKENPSIELLSSQKTIQDLKQINNKLSLELESTKKTMNDFLVQQKSEQISIDTYKLEISMLKKDLVQLQDKLRIEEEAHKNLKNRQNDYEFIKQEKNSLQTDKLQLQKNVEDLQNKNHLLNKEIDSLKIDLQTSTSTINKCRVELTRKTNEYESLQKSHNNALKGFEKDMDGEKSRWERKLQEAQAQYVRQEEQLKALTILQSKAKTTTAAAAALSIPQPQPPSSSSLSLSSPKPRFTPESSISYPNTHTQTTFTPPPPPFPVSSSTSTDVTRYTTPSASMLSTSTSYRPANDMNTSSSYVNGLTEGSYPNTNNNNNYNNSNVNSQRSVPISQVVLTTSQHHPAFTNNNNMNMNTHSQIESQHLPTTGRATSTSTSSHVRSSSTGHYHPSQHHIIQDSSVSGSDYRTLVSQSHASSNIANSGNIPLQDQSQYRESRVSSISKPKSLADMVG